MKMRGDDRRHILRSHLRRAVRQWPTFLEGARSRDESQHYLASLIHVAGQISHLMGKLGIKDQDESHEVSVLTIEAAISTLHREDPNYFSNRVMREFRDEYSGFVQTLSLDLSPERLGEGGIPCGDWTEFEYELFLRDRFQYVSNEQEKLEGTLSEDMQHAIGRHEKQLKEAIPVVMKTYARMGHQYADHPDLYPSDFWWRHLAWDSYLKALATTGPDQASH